MNVYKAVNETQMEIEWEGDVSDSFFSDTGIKRWTLTISLMLTGLDSVWETWQINDQYPTYIRALITLKYKKSLTFNWFHETH